MSIAVSPHTRAVCFHPSKHSGRGKCSISTEQKHKTNITNKRHLFRLTFKPFTWHLVTPCVQTNTKQSPMASNSLSRMTHDGPGCQSISCTYVAGKMPTTPFSSPSHHPSACLP
ncbi:hypothetical protein L798_13460 [Zootermopsis nevadensis]|uniref:Uncharacterized protein n=1 Tax=Zootermopsis nevadensis TaxID=136037 RepID=A0A067QYT9_ZOONE|nr:hypothetical protein L798_13460 [Zootermopsis nevadensis]